MAAHVPMGVDQMHNNMRMLSKELTKSPEKGGIWYLRASRHGNLKRERLIGKSANQERLMNTIRETLTSAQQELQEISTLTNRLEKSTRLDRFVYRSRKVSRASDALPPTAIEIAQGVLNAREVTDQGIKDLARSILTLTNTLHLTDRQVP